MAEPIVRLEPTRLSVEPGSQVTATVAVHNPGTVVEGYDLDVVSATAMPWATVAPSTLSVYPQQEASAVVTFAPPTGPQTPGGSCAFGVRVRSQVDPAATAVVEGDLDIGAVSGLQASLTPVTSKGRWQASHKLTVTNYGNSAAHLQLSAKDPDEALGFLVSPPTLEVPLGGHGYARIKVRTRHPVLRGTVQRLPFQVVCDPTTPDLAGMAPRPSVATPERPVVDGAFNQKPILDRWVVLLAGLLVLGLVALVVYLMNRPEPEEPEEPVAPPDQPVAVRAVAAPGVISLTWDQVANADGYEVVMTEPATDTKPANAQPVIDDPSRVEFRMETDRAGQHCYAVYALRDEAPRSAASERACADAQLTPEQQAGPSPTAAPSIAPVPGFEPSPSPSPSADASPSPTDTGSPSPSETTSAPPGPVQFLAVLKAYEATNQQQAQLDLAAAQDAGVATAGVGLAAELGVLAAAEEAGLSYEETPVLLYVGGDSADAALAACEQARAALPDAFLNLCVPRFTLRVDPSATPAGGGPST